MTDNSAVESAEPESLPHGSEDGHPLGDAPSRSSRKKVLRVVVLAVIGLALLALGLGLYPQRAEAPAPIPAAVYVSGTSYAMNNIINIFYAVEQIQPNLARVSVDLEIGPLNPPPGATAEIRLQAGAHVKDCSPRCDHTGKATSGSAYVTFRPGGFADAEFLVKARSYGATSNGVTANATFPQVELSGAAQHPMLLINYQIPAASSYDWSSNPPRQLLPGHAEWVEPITIEPGITISQVEAGTNHAAEQRDSNFTLIAGILFGIGGGALVAAVQEALHD